MLLGQSSPIVQALLGSHFSVVPAVLLSQSGVSGTLDLSSRLTAYSLNNSMNDATGSAVFTFSVGKNDGSLSPLIAASTLRLGTRPALDPNLDIVLNLTVKNATGAELGSFARFAGRVDRINVAASGTTVSVQCRDRGARYLNTFMVATQQFGTAVGTAIETVMGDILTSDGFSPASLWVPVSPGYMITDFFTGERSVLDILRILAQQIGWDVRHFVSDPSDLRFYDPGRTRIQSDLTLGPTRYSAIAQLGFGDEDLRNIWDVYYPDCVEPGHAQDDASIARYGVRYARIGEDRTLNIRTLEAADRLAAAALADTKDPFASQEIRMPIFPVVELNDLYTFQANGAEYDTDLTMAVVGYREDWKANKAPTERTMPTTTIQARGQPISAYRDYRKSKDPQVIVSANPPDPTRYAPEGTIWEHVPELTA